MIHNQTSIEFQTQSHDDDGFAVTSPPLWRNLRSRSYKNNQYSSPLLPHNHRYSSFSPASRTRAVEEGRRELMEMVQSMPESSFELSLRDMVEEQHILQGQKEEPPETEAEKVKKQNRKKMKGSSRKGPIVRATSMDNEVFQIKMFFPSSLGPKKKAMVRDGSGVSPRPSFQQSESDGGRDGWFKRCLFVKEAEGMEKGSIGGSRSSSNSSSTSNGSSRHGYGRLLHSCWPLLRGKKGKSKDASSEIECDIAVLYN